LLAASLLAMNAGPSMRRTALALVGNWLACMMAVVATGMVDPWLAFMAIDIATAAVVLRHPATRPQAYIGCIYIVQITASVAYALVGQGAATGVYLSLLTGGGWLQIAILAGGAIYGTGKRRAIARDLACGSSPAVARHSGSPASRG
jgi:hypothetical protein